MIDTQHNIRQNRVSNHTHQHDRDLLHFCSECIFTRNSNRHIP